MNKFKKTVCRNTIFRNVIAPVVFSSSMIVGSIADVVADDKPVPTEQRIERSTREVRTDTREGVQEVKRDSGQAWSNVKQESKEAWRDTKSAFSEGVLEGKLEMALILNKNLNPFEIDIDVEGDKAVLEGEVGSEIDRDLAQSIANGIEGINSVDNRLTVNKDYKATSENQVTRTRDADRDFSQFFADVSTTASIKTELLANDNIKGMEIDVDTVNNQVTLSGEVRSEAQKSLAESIVKKRDDVTRVVNNIRVNS